MGPKYKVTGCARFFLFFLFFVPAVFFGAAYFRGENGVQIIKDFYHNVVGGTSGEKVKEDAKDVVKEEPKDEANSKGRTQELEAELKQANEEIKELKAKLYEKDQEIAKLKAGQ